MGRKKMIDATKITVRMPKELGDWVRAKGQALSLDDSSTVRMLLQQIKQQEENDGRNKNSGQ